MKIIDSFPEEHLYSVNVAREEEPPWFIDFASYLAAGTRPNLLTYQQWKKFYSDLKFYLWEDPHLFRVCTDQVVMRCVSHSEGYTILKHCHAGPIGGHYSANRTTKKVLNVASIGPQCFKTQRNLCNIVTDVKGPRIFQKGRNASGLETSL